MGVSSHIRITVPACLTLFSTISYAQIPSVDLETLNMIPVLQVAFPSWTVPVALSSMLWIITLSIVAWICIRQKNRLRQKADVRAHEMYKLNVLLEEKQEEIILQNEQLRTHREDLEKLVSERTEQMQKALKRAEDADRLKSAFLANMSHEIRTPMNAIVGFASLLNNEDVDELERKEFNEIIANNCNSLMVLINDILEISLIEANQLHLRKEKFDVHRILSELEYYFKMNNGKKLEICFDNAEEDSLEIVNDPIRFRQIFTNLLNNAYKYTEEGSIHFGYTRSEEGIRYYVKDTGIGIDEKEYENIFNYFHKLDKDTNQYYRGAGIGLSISNKLIEMMGGRIWLKSKRGEGSNFQFTFSSFEKKEDSFFESDSKNDEKGKNNILDNRTVLVAEDDATNFFLIEKILKREGMNVVWAKNGAEAVKFVERSRNKEELLVLMDIKMPQMNGMNAAAEIARFCPDIPVIAVTAFAQQSNKKDILQKNFVDYIAKPLRPKTLINVLHKHIRVAQDTGAF